MVYKPFSIKIPATEPIQQLAVFDYDQRRNYRFALAQGKSVRMYDNKGKRVSGFTFKKTKLLNMTHKIKNFVYNEA